MADSFPRQQARTRRFTLGVPRSFQVSPDGERIAFLRSQGGSDPLTCLWLLDLATGERLIADPAAFATQAPDASAVAADATGEPPREKARRERSREAAAGIVSFATDHAMKLAVFAVAGQVYLADLPVDRSDQGRGGGDGSESVSGTDRSGRPRSLGARYPAIDPRPDPTGSRVAYVCERALRRIDLHTGADTEVIGPGSATGLSYGLAEFIAAEEMGRQRGYWWAPDGSALLVARVDEANVHRWHIADPANPGQRPNEVAYPAAGTPNAVVSLLIVGLDGSSVPVAWDNEAFCYLVTVDWDPKGGLLLVVQTRDQRRMRLLEVDPRSGTTRTVREDIDEPWLDIVPGVPARTTDSRIVWTTIADGARRLLVATAEDLARGRARPVTPATIEVREILSVDGQTVLFAGSESDPSEVSVWTYDPGGLTRVSAHPGVHTAVNAANTTVLSSGNMVSHGVTTRVLRKLEEVASIASLAELPALPPLRTELVRAGRRGLRTALLLPSWYDTERPVKLPVLMDPYGGPHAQRVLAAADLFLTSQWFAEQGFAVIVADGRGTPGRGPEWERTVAGDLASPALDDQVDALVAIAEHCAEQGRADLDLSKVAIRGWSFGGYLAALAVLRRPDVFHAAIAGAPVTDWRLYDTHYTERYLGDPGQNAAAYERSSLIDDAHKLSRPLMIIHGLVDDNVFVAHSLRLSSALLAAGRPHSVLPLSGVTHLASQEAVAENLLLLQVAFLRDALGINKGTRI